MAEFIQRLSVSSIILLILFTSIYFSHEPFFKPIFVLIAALVISGAVWEYYLMGRVKKNDPLIKVGVVGSFVFVVAVGLTTLPIALFTLLLTLMASFAVYFVKGSSPYRNLAVTAFGLVYLALPLSCMVKLNFLPSGQLWFLYLLLVTKLTDTAAYFVGKQWGRHKLTPFISPGKTWEGTIGGVCTGTAASIMMTLFLPLGIVESLILGIIIAATAQFGDLAESLLKRDVGVKDSNTIPGLGGLLDIVDSLIFTAPLLYLYLMELHI